jgi:hypothetical protein
MRLDDFVNDIVGSVTGRRRDEDVQPASHDPWGDPADQQGDVAPASQDPYGDPADQYRGQQVWDSSQDPYGDPGDPHGQRAQDSSQDPYGDPADEEEAPRGGGLLDRILGR